MSLKLRLNLIITALLCLVMLTGILLNIENARQNVRAEVESTEKLTLYLFDTGILNNTSITLKNLSENKSEISPLHLQSLKHMRHLRIEFYDKNQYLIDSNRAKEPVEKINYSPRWFRSVMNYFSPKWQPQKREIDYQGVHLGQLVITPDPTYEYAEVWKQIKDLFLLLILFFLAINLLIAWVVGQALNPTLRIFETLNHLEAGDLKARLPRFKLPELARIGDKFNHMVETLEQSTHRNHQLAQQLINLQEAERKSLARDLHDEFGQCLTAIHADATVVLQIAKKKYPEIQESATAIAQLSKHLMAMVGGLLQYLRPGVLGELGLIAALQELVVTWQARNEQVQSHLSIVGELPNSMSEATQVTIYRLVQECLTNVARHAQAKTVHIWMRIKRKSERQLHIEICVQDDGIGFDVNTAKGFGLLGMRERVEGLGGALIVKSHSKATEIKAHLPLML